MLAADVRDAVKTKFRITIADLDNDIDDCVAIAVDSLAPYVKNTVIDVSTTISTDAAEVAIPASLTGGDISAIYIAPDGENFHPFVDWFKSGDFAWCSETLSAGTVVRFHGAVPYTLADIDNIPLFYAQQVVKLACAEFAMLLAGDKSRYNIYVQSNGARAVDNMLDLSNFYRSIAENELSKAGGSEYRQ